MTIPTPPPPVSLGLGFSADDGQGQGVRLEFEALVSALNGRDAYALALAQAITDAGALAAGKAGFGDIAGEANLGHTPVLDTNYQVVATDVDVEYTALTGPRTIFLCDVDTFPYGQDPVIYGGTGNCSSTNTLTIAVGTGTGDTIQGQSDGTITPSNANQSVRLRRGGANTWKIV